MSIPNDKCRFGIRRCSESHVIDDELENVNSNAFQKAIDQEERRTPCMTIFS